MLLKWEFQVEREYYGSSRSTVLFSFQETNFVGAKFCSTETNIYVRSKEIWLFIRSTIFTSIEYYIYI